MWWRARRRVTSLAAAVAAMQRSALASPRWTTKTAAIRALVVIAVRSGEPFRLRCYGALRDATRAEDGSQRRGGASGRRRAGGRGGGDARSLLPRRFEISRDGGAIRTGSVAVAPAALAETAGRRAVLLELTARTCYLPKGKYEPLGAASAAFADAFAGDAAAAASLAARLMGKEAADAEDARRKEKRVAEGFSRRSGSSPSRTAAAAGSGSGVGVGWERRR